MDADKRDGGVRLSADDVAVLADDEMISARAAVDDEVDVCAARREETVKCTFCGADRNSFGQPLRDVVKSPVDRRNFCGVDHGGGSGPHAPALCLHHSLCSGCNHASHRAPCRIAVFSHETLSSNPKLQPTFTYVACGCQAVRAA